MCALCMHARTYQIHMYRRIYAVPYVHYTTLKEIPTFSDRSSEITYNDQKSKVTFVEPHSLLPSVHDLPHLINYSNEDVTIL